jgi:hypothetical protein
MVPVGHFAAGASCAFFVNILIYIKRKGQTTFRHLVWMPVSMVMAGFWAFGPDWLRLLKYLLHRKLAYSNEAHHPGWPDIFFFHGIFDTRYPGSGTIVGLAVTILIFSALILIYLLEIKKLGKK